MLGSLYNYLSHRNVTQDGKFRLAMTLLVRDEVDVIENNIRFHAKMGVDVFWVMDHKSQDGTREILQELSREFDLHIVDQKSDSFYQGEWMTFLAKQAREVSGADWCIHNDADEFWMPKNSTSLKEALMGFRTVVRVPRVNMLISEEDISEEKPFSEFTWRTHHSVLYPEKDEAKKMGISINLAGALHKSTSSLHGLVFVKAGQHNIKHIGDMVLGRKYEAFTHNIMIYHYPTRSYQQFERVAQNRYERLKRVESEKDFKTNYGTMSKRRAKVFEEGHLKEEFELLTYSEKDLMQLERYGVVSRDRSISDILAET